MVQLIALGHNGRAEPVKLWRTGDYSYEIEVGSAARMRTVKFPNTEYYDAMEAFDTLVDNYQELCHD